MSSVKVNFSDLPESATKEIEKGLYILEIKDIIESEMLNGGSKFVLSHEIVGTGVKITYDNYALFNADGSRHNFGLSKLRALITALGIDIEEINLPLLHALLIGKRFKARIVLNEKKFPQIEYTNIYPLAFEERAMNEDLQEATKDKTKEATKFVTETLGKPIITDDI